MVDALTVVFIILHVIWWPINKLINTIIILLSPFYHVISFVLLPCIHLGHAIVRVLSIPFTVKWLERIEVNYHHSSYSIYVQKHW
jgi:hypothetical protein